MAWNQPSGQNNNPWGRRPGQPGADLEERLKSLQRRLSSFMSPGGGREGSAIFVYVLLAVAVAWWLASGAYTVGQAQRAIIQRFGAYVETRPPGLGWHIPWPIETVTKVNVASVDSNKFKSRVLTSDGNLVDLHFAVQYQYTDPKKTLFSVREPGQTLSEADIHAHCQANLARFKCPRTVRFVDALPRNATGKIHKPTLRKSFATASAVDLVQQAS